MTIGCAVVGCSLAMTLSVWARKTHEVVMMTYVLIILWLIFPGLVAIAMHNLGTTRPPFLAAPVFWQFVLDTNPYFLIFAPYNNPAKVDLTTFLAFLGSCLAASAGLVGLATVRIRKVALRQAGRPAAGPRRRWLPRLRRPSWLPRLPGPSLDANPVAWREWHRMRPSGLMRIIWGVYAALGVLWLLLLLTRGGSPRMIAEELGMMSGFQVGLGLLLLSVGAATSLAEERVRGSLDVLLATPMSTRSILAGKWRGTFRQVGPVLFWPAVLGGLLLLHSGNLFSYLLLIGSILAYGALITSLGLAMATRVSRLGRAVAMCVSAYVIFSIGWPTLVVMLVREQPAGPCLVIGCPAIGGFMATAAMAGPERFGPGDHLETYKAAVTIWMVLDLIAAAALFGWTSSSFDRLLGRMPEYSERPSAPRETSKPKLDTDELL